MHRGEERDHGEITDEAKRGHAARKCSKILPAPACFCAPSDSDDYL